MLFKQELQNIEAEESSSVILCCELTKPDVLVEWRKGSVVLSPSEKYDMVQNGACIELIIRNLKPEDEGEYICDSGDQQTTAFLNVKGRIAIIFWRNYCKETNSFSRCTLIFHFFYINYCS